MELLRNEYVVLELDATKRLVRFTREPARFASLDVIEQRFPEVMDALAHVERGSHALLVDLRRGPMRNDEAFEQAIGKHVGALGRGWRKSASLVRTAVGRLQLERHARDSGSPSAVFQEEDEALRYLLG